MFQEMSIKCHSKCAYLNGPFLCKTATSPPPLCFTSAHALSHAFLTDTDAVIIDLRSAADFQKGHLVGSTSIPVEVLPGKVCAQHRSQRCIGREGASEAAPEAVRQAVGGGCQSGWGRLLSVTNAIEAGIWR